MLAHYARDFPFSSLLLGLLGLALPFLLALRAKPGESESRWLTWYARSLVATGILVALTASLRYLIAARPAVDGLDFYFYLCFARDALHGVVDPSLAKYAYFPGGFRFWELMLALVGENLSTMQCVFVALLATNAGLCGLIVFRCVRSAGAGILAVVWYLALASRFEGLDGTTEILCTLFALLGLLAWGGQPFRGAAGWRRAVLLGAALGLATWVKQQGGLVALGAVILAFGYATNRPAERDRFLQLLAIPLVALGVLLVALLLEGHGLAPMVSGIWHVAIYEPLGTLVKNLSRLARQAGPGVWIVVLVAYFWVAMLVTSAATGRRHGPWGLVVGFCLIAALATFVQFAKRSSPHYGLLAAPFLAIAVTAMAARAVQVAGTLWPRLRPVLAIAATGVLLLPAVGSMGRDGFFQVWPLVWDPVVLPQAIWHEDPDLAADIVSLGPLVERGENALVIPPRRNVVHYLLGTVSIANPNGYGWGGSWDATRAIGFPSLQTVIVLNPRTLEAGDADLCRQIGCRRAIAALPEQGFQRALTLTSMTVWRRDGVASGPQPVSRPIFGGIP